MVGQAVVRRPAICAKRASLITCCGNILPYATNRSGRNFSAISGVSGASP